MEELEFVLALSSDAKRTKRSHTRSRTGCVVCRQRRVRCDEKLPTCTNCTIGQRLCSYAHGNIPLRERRAKRNPGEHAPWTALSTLSTQSSSSSSESSLHSVDPGRQKRLALPSSPKLALGEALDPFDTLHFKMPFKSKELFHYFYHAGSCFGNVPGTQKFITANIHDPDVFRNTLLIAGLHYAWNVGDLSSFDSTFLFHKIQSIRTINTLIEGFSSSSMILCVRHIATLCVVECCLGDFATAETHLNGLMLLMETNGAYETISRTPKEDLDWEFAERAFNLVHSLKSRFDDFMISNLARIPSSKHMDSKEVAHLIHEWHMHEVVGIAPRLRAMNMFPSFLSPVSEGAEIQQVNIEPILDCMRNITAVFDLRYSELEHGTDRASQYYLWASSGPSKLLSAVIDAHISSITDHSDDDSSQNLKSSWSGICIAVGLYLTSVLGVWNQGRPPENRLLYYNLRILRQDLDENFADIIGQDATMQRIWFWKAFLGAFSLAHGGLVVDDGVFGYAKLLDLVPVFNDYLRTSARRMRFKRWGYAKDLLGKIVFPTHFKQEALAQALWNRALSGPK